MNINERQPEEMQEHYHERLRLQRKDDKLNAKGRLLWDSSKQGTYIKSKHGWPL